MNNKRQTAKDFAGLNNRFRPSRAPASAPERRPSTSSFVYRPSSVRNTQKVFNHRVQSWLRHSAVRALGYLGGGALFLYGVLNAGGILTLRGSQISLVNNLLLVFTGCFLVFLANHERAVERGSRG